jgi:glycosyltransferase involved in cell wall biosynthesis
MEELSTHPGTDPIWRHGGGIRVLHIVSTNERRGAEVFAADLVSMLVDTGIEQLIVILRDVGGQDLPFAAPIAFAGAVPHLWSRAPIDPRTEIALRAVVRSWRPTVVQAHGGEALKYPIPLSRHAPVVYRRVGATPEWMAGRARRAVYGALMRRATSVVAVAEALRQEAILRFGVHRDRVTVVPNAVDAQRATPRLTRSSARRSMGITATAQVVLWVGALTDEKDPLAAVAVADMTMAALPDALFLLVGHGQLHDRVAAAAQAGLDGRVRLMGARNDISDLMAAADVILGTSRTEGMPGCLIEAGMAGLPTVSVAVGGVPELIEDGKTGYLTPPGNVAALSHALVGLLQHADRGQAIGRAARERCVSRFDIRSVAPRYAELYRSAGRAADSARPPR